MPRRSSAKVTGVWEKEPGTRESGGFATGRTESFTARRWGVSRTPWPSIRNARMKSGWAQNCRRICVGRRFVSGSSPKTSGATARKHHRDRGHIESRLKLILPDFENRLADQINPEDIDGWIARNTKAAATANRYRALFSLFFARPCAMGR